MSDFLSSLVERATGEAPILEYRRASLFEPLKKTMPLDEPQTEPALLETETEILSKGKPTDPDSEIDVSKQTKPAQRNVSTETYATIAPVEKTAPIQPQPLSETKPRSEQSEERLSTIVDRAEQSTSKDARPSTTATQKAAVKEVMRVPGRVVETRLEREVDLVRASNKDSPSVEKNARADPAAPQVQLIKPPFRHVQSDIAPQSKRPTQIDEKSESSPAKISPVKPAELPPRFPGSFVRSPLRSASTPANLPPPAPTVQVTIGRVEVRAAPPPALKQPAERFAPKLSLEDYLRSRSGERT